MVWVADLLFGTLFPSLIGRLKPQPTELLVGVESLFPSLIGRLKPTMPISITVKIRFPSLIGRLKPGQRLRKAVISMRFPSLIGRLKPPIPKGGPKPHTDVSIPHR